MSEQVPQTPLLQVDNVTKHYPVRGWVPWRPTEVVHALDGVTLQLAAGESVGIVGESGCGKTTLARLVLRQVFPTTGRVLVNGHDVERLRRGDLKTYRSTVQAVLQDPWASLNPRLRVKLAVGEPLIINKGLRGGGLSAEVASLLKAVGLEPALADSYPHELSGGMRQRVAIARALSLHPSLVVLDEPVSSLDVSIRAQVMNLLKDLHDSFGLSYLMISHNLTTVRYLSERILVMYLGKIVETGPAGDLLDEPHHPYTRALVTSSLVSRTGRKAGNRVILQGTVPSATAPPRGCRFNTRCPLVFDRCRIEEPRLQSVGTARTVACHLFD